MDARAPDGEQRPKVEAPGALIVAGAFVHVGIEYQRRVATLGAPVRAERQEYRHRVVRPLGVPDQWEEHRGLPFRALEVPEDREDDALVTAVAAIAPPGQKRQQQPRT